MKTLGVAMLFGLCTLIGVRIAAQKTARLKTVQGLRSDLCRFAERISSGCGTLTDAANEQGLFWEMLCTYLNVLSEGGAENIAAEKAAERFDRNGACFADAKAFFAGLSKAQRQDLRNRTERYAQSLDRAEREAEAGAAQARVIRVSGALIGAGLAILLL